MKAPVPMAQRLPRCGQVNFNDNFLRYRKALPCDNHANPVIGKIKVQCAATTSLLASTLCFINRLPINTIKSAKIDELTITAAIGSELCCFITEMPIDDKAPTAICEAPNIAEAEPAFLVKGARDNADVFGAQMPMQHNTPNIIAMVPPMLNQ